MRVPAGVAAGLSFMGNTSRFWALAA
jgi:hypothetical protein